MPHNEAREPLLKACDKLGNVKEVAECFSVDKSAVYRLVEPRERTGSYLARTNLRRRKPALSQEQN